METNHFFRLLKICIIFDKLQLFNNIYLCKINKSKIFSLFLNATLEIRFPFNVRMFFF